MNDLTRKCVVGFEKLWMGVKTIENGKYYVGNTWN